MIADAPFNMEQMLKGKVENCDGDNMEADDDQSADGKVGDD